MEERLIPWHHFIPLDIDNLAADTDSKMQWVLENDAEAQRIAHQGSLWIRDLWMHPQAAYDDEEITKEIILRYAAHFRRVTDLGDAS